MGQAQTKNKKKISNHRISKFDAKEEYFIKNGGILLEKRIALSQGRKIGPRLVKYLSYKDIEKATNHLDPNLLLGSNAHNKVYKGTIDDFNLIIAIPLQQEVAPQQIDRILTEAATLMVMNHCSIVKLYGCCLETCIPILVYEYVSGGGGLFHHLYGDIASSKRMKLADCVRVASDTAYALSYMHDALLKPVVHRDVNSSSIILDNSFHGKLLNFGYSVSITPGETRQKWPVEGTPGYVDPEYIETGEVTDKCDVYSLGVLMLEMLTRRQPLLMAKVGADLANVFVSAVEKNCMMELINNDVLEQATRDEIQRVAKLALSCVAKKGAERPTMIEIVGELWRMQGRNKLCMA